MLWRLNRCIPSLLLFMWYIRRARRIKIFVIKVYFLQYYFESHLIYRWRYYRQTIFNQFNIMVSYVDIIGLFHSVTILWEFYVMQPKCQVRWLCFHFKSMHNYGTWSIDFDSRLSVNSWIIKRAWLSFPKDYADLD